MNHENGSPSAAAVAAGLSFPLGPGYAERQERSRSAAEPARLPLDRPLAAVAKRTLDLALALLVILGLLSWLLPLVALLIWLDDPGPVFFAQRREGRGGRPFACLKFRTMVPNADADHLPVQEQDPRITRVGRFLRERHIDEFPQFLNVLRGDMSVVGPRPHMLSENRYYDQRITAYAFRHCVRPGITGPGQLQGRGLPPGKKMEQRVRLDHFYIRHWTFWWDIRIIGRTCVYFWSKPRRQATAPRS